MRIHNDSTPNTQKLQGRTHYNIETGYWDTKDLLEVTRWGTVITLTVSVVYGKMVVKFVRIKNLLWKKTLYYTTNLKYTPFQKIYV